MHPPTFEDLRGKVCVVTGGTGGLGSALMEAFASCGVNLAILGRRGEVAHEHAQTLSKEFGTENVGVRADVTDKRSLLQARTVVTETLGQPHILINGAGGNAPEATTKAARIDKGSLPELDTTLFGLNLEGFRKVFDLNFMGTLLPTLVFCEEMVKAGRGAVLNISSMNSFKPLTRIPAYSAAKAAINNFTQWLAVHFAGTGVRVNAVAPGFFLTDQNRFLLVDETTGQTTPRGRTIINHTPMGRYGTPAELQGTCLYLVSDLSAFVTGVVIPVDGGFSAFSGV